MTTTWDAKKNRGFVLSNGNLTATGHPKDGTKGAIVYVWATTALPPKQRTYFEIAMSHAAVFSAAVVGVGKYIKSGDYITQKPHAPDATLNPVPSDAVKWGYNNASSNRGYNLFDPQGVWNTDQTKHPANVVWGHPGPTPLGIMVDFVSDEITYKNGADGSVIGPFHISGLVGETVFPFIRNWDVPGVVGTINGGGDPKVPFALGLPTGYTPLG